MLNHHLSEQRRYARLAWTLHRRAQVAEANGRPDLAAGLEYQSRLAKDQAMFAHAHLMLDVAEGVFELRERRRAKR